MGWVEALQKAIEFIEKNMNEPITIEDIAKQAGASPFHFHRVFSMLTDMTVADYLRKRRLTCAAQELAVTNERVLNIALKYGYETPESFANGLFLRCTVQCRMQCKRCENKFIRNGFHRIHINTRPAFRNLNGIQMKTFIGKIRIRKFGFRLNNREKKQSRKSGLKYRSR